MPERPELENHPRGSWLAIALVLFAGVAITVVLTFLTLGFFGPFVVLAAALFGVRLGTFISATAIGINVKRIKMAAFAIGLIGQPSPAAGGADNLRNSGHGLARQRAALAPLSAGVLVTGRPGDAASCIGA